MWGAAVVVEVVVAVVVFARSCPDCCVCSSLSLLGPAPFAGAAPALESAVSNLGPPRGSKSRTDLAIYVGFSKRHVSGEDRLAVPFSGPCAACAPHAFTRPPFGYPLGPTPESQLNASLW